MNLSRLLYYCDFTTREYQFNSFKDTKKFKKNMIQSPNYCVLCNSEIKSHFIRDHRGNKDYYWCSNLCYKLYLNRKRNRQNIENEQQLNGSNVGPRNFKYKKLCCYICGKCN